jgi:hypothetical protein
MTREHPLLTIPMSSFGTRQYLGSTWRTALESLPQQITAQSCSRVSCMTSSHLHHPMPMHQKHFKSPPRRLPIHPRTSLIHVLPTEPRRHHAHDAYMPTCGYVAVDPPRTNPHATKAPQAQRHQGVPQSPDHSSKKRHNFHRLARQTCNVTQATPTSIALSIPIRANLFSTQHTIPSLLAKNAD